MSPQGFYLYEFGQSSPSRVSAWPENFLTSASPNHAARRNGLQLECLAEYPTFFRDYYYKLLARIMTFPLHTIAAINGHCFAGGLCLALACDWRICRVRRLFLAATVDQTVEC